MKRRHIHIFNLKEIISSLICIFIFYANVYAQNERPLVREGNKLYKEKKFSDAEVSYKKSLNVNKDSRYGQFNLGNAFYKQGKYEDADSLLVKLVNFYPDDILADDALFLLGQLNDNQFKNPSRAMEYYQKLLTDYPGSIFVVDARKRFRALRGDKIN